MKQLSLVLLLAVSPLIGQSLYLDLSGEWRISDCDDASFASQDCDDSSAQVTLRSDEVVDAAKAWGQNDDITVGTVRRKA